MTYLKVTNGVTHKMSEIWGTCNDCGQFGIVDVYRQNMQNGVVLVSLKCDSCASIAIECGDEFNSEVS